MEIVFENNYTRNKDTAKELYRYLYFQKPLFIVLDIFLAFTFVINVVYIFIGEAYNLSILIGNPIVFILQTFLYFSHINAMVKRDRELCKNGITIHTIVTNDYVQSTSSLGDVNTLEYSNIQHVAQTKHLLLLFTKAKLIYILKKDAFTKGNGEDFLAFLKEKGIK